MKQEFKKYMTSYRGAWKVMSYIAVALMVALAASGILGADIEPLGFVVFAAWLAVCLIPLWKSTRFFRKLEADGVADQVQADFAKSMPMRKDHVRFGERWVFTKGSVRLRQYSEIWQVYQQIHRTNFVEDRRELRCVDVNGKDSCLCKLELRGASDEEVRKMAAMIYAKNPNVKFGI